MNYTLRYLALITLLSTLTACLPDASRTHTSFSGSEAAAIKSNAIVPAVELQTPAQVLEEVNRLYNTTTNDCREATTQRRRGHYYCSGVLLRSVTDGNYDPWTYSPDAVETGATSYSWIRFDVPTDRIFHPAGFILRNPNEAIAHGLPAKDTGVICVYPFDAVTSFVPHRGCGLHEGFSYPGPIPTGNSAAWGSCENEAGVHSAAEWNAYFIEHKTSPDAQCSWGAESQTGWDAMIESRPVFKYKYGDLWNEVMMGNEGDGSQMPPYIQAFFYDTAKANGLVAAQHFQTRLSAAGYKVPILRLDLKTGEANRFTYVESDQVVAQ